MQAAWRPAIRHASPYKRLDSRGAAKQAGKGNATGNQLAGLAISEIGTGVVLWFAGQMLAK